MSELQLVVQNLGDVVVVNLSGPTILDGSTVDALGEELFKLVDEQARRKILLDFTRVKFLSSAILGVLIRLQKRVASIKGRMALLGLRPDLHKVFKISKLDRLFEFFDNEQDALNSFDVYTSQ